jgi:nicotinamide-nucleotide amidase
MKKLVENLIQRNMSLAVAESFTSGLFSSELGRIAGVSEVFKGSVVVYSVESKKILLGIDQDLIDRHGTISVEVTRAMAQSVRERLNARIGLAFSGNAGPSAIEGKKTGLWYLGVCMDDHCTVYEFQDDLSRNVLRRKAVYDAQEYVLKHIKER